MELRGLVPAGHKVAAHDIAQGAPVRRYNQIIGFASRPIAQGEHVHTQNLDMGPDKGDFARDYAHMRSQGVRFTEEPRHEEYGTVVVFLDLYGNKWDLIGRKRTS